MKILGIGVGILLVLLTLLALVPVAIGYSGRPQGKIVIEKDFKSGGF
jgi:hypothetical protein